MSVPQNRLQRQIAGCLVMFMTMPFAQAAIALPQQAPVGQQTDGASSAQTQSPGPGSTIGAPAANSTRSGTAPENPGGPGSQGIAPKQSSGTSQSPPQQQKNPVGTAVAPYEKTVGVAASSPAGAVIAPAKQRRARSILIRVALLVGAAVAIGSVIALSKASHSRP